MSSAKTGTSKGFRGSTSYYCYSHVPRMRWTKVLDNPVDTAPTLWVNHTLFTVKSLNMVHIEGFVTVCSACGFVQTIWPYTIPIVWRFSLKNPLGFPGRQVSPPRSARIGLKKKLSATTHVGLFSNSKSRSAWIDDQETVGSQSSVGRTSMLPVVGKKDSPLDKPQTSPDLVIIALAMTQNYIHLLYVLLFKI